MSNPTRNAREIVRETIERDGVIRKGLARGLINSRALARYIMVATNDAPSFEAILSAIRRYPIKKSAARYRRIGSYITKLTMRNKIVDIEIRNEQGIPASLARFSAELDARTETFQIAFGLEAITVIVDMKNVDKLMELIPKKKVIKIYGNLAEIMITLSEAVMEIPGVFASITTEVAMNDINILNCFAYGIPPEVRVIVDEKEGVKAYQSLERLSEAR